MPKIVTTAYGGDNVKRSIIGMISHLFSAFKLIKLIRLIVSLCIYLFGSIQGILRLLLKFLPTSEGTFSLEGSVSLLIQSVLFFWKGQL